MSDFENKIPLRKALLYVFLSASIIWGSVSIAWWYRGYTLQKRQRNPLYTINTIVQSSRNESISSRQLAAILELSKDVHTNLYCFDTKKAVERLQACPVIKKAVVRKIRPGIVYIDYETRKAKARIANYDNMVCDQEGVIFPLLPFFSAKNLPEVYLDLRSFDKEVTWNMSLKSEKLDLAFAIIDFVQAHFPPDIELKRVDVHKASAPSAGERGNCPFIPRGRQGPFCSLEEQFF